MVFLFISRSNYLKTWFIVATKEESLEVLDFDGSNLGLKSRVELDVVLIDFKKVLNRVDR